MEFLRIDSTELYYVSAVNSLQFRTYENVFFKSTLKNLEKHSFYIFNFPIPPRISICLSDIAYIIFVSLIFGTT